MRLDDKVAVVTGGASGIGRGIVELFVSAGASIALFDIDGKAIDEASTSLGDRGRIFPIRGDVANEADVSAAIETTISHFGRIDIVINNAGIETPGTVLELTPDQWDRVLAVNLRGAFLFSRAAIPHMQRQGGGSIINISSIHAFVSYPASVAYDSSKAALIGFTRTLALDHGSDQIRVNAICPGYIRTPLMDQWLESLPNPEETMHEVFRHHPLGRIGVPLDIAQACLFLASDFSSFITGTFLTVDGAMTASGH